MSDRLRSQNQEESAQKEIDENSSQEENEQENAEAELLNGAENRSINNSNSVTCYQEDIDVCFTISGVILYILDLLTDLYLAVKYFRGGYWGSFAMTSTFIFGPAIITAIYRYISHLRSKDKLSTLKKMIDVLFTILQVQNLKINFEYLLCSLNAHFFKKYPNYVDAPPKYSQKYRDRVNWLIGELVVLRLVEALLEGLPQVLIQFYVAYNQLGDPDGPFGGKITFDVGLAISFSLMSSTWTICFVYKSHVSGSPLLEKTIPTIWSLILMFLGNFLILGTRLVVLELVLIYSPVWFAIGSFIHSFMMFLYITVQNKCKSISRSYTEHLGGFLRSISYIFIYAYITPSKVHSIYWVFQIVYLIENAIIVGLWVNYMGDPILTVTTLSLFFIGQFLLFMHAALFRQWEMIRSKGGSPERIKVRNDVCRHLGVGRHEH